MHHAQRIEEIRRQLIDTFSRMEVREPDQFRESILIRNGTYCGRRFEAEGAYAIWFLEENEVKFYRTHHRPSQVEPQRTQSTRIAA